MLNECNPIKEGQQFKKFFPTNCPDRAVIHGILEGKVCGKLWLNNERNACLITSASFNFIAGNVDDRFLALCLNVLPRTKGSFLVNCSDAYAFPSHLPYKRRLHYSGTVNDLIDLPPELDNEISRKFQLNDINDLLFDNCHWQARFLELYQTKEQFLKFGYGAVLLEASKIVAELYGVIGGQYFEIGAFVHENYRGYRLIPFMVSHALKPYCSAQKLSIVASCDSDNISSEKSMIYFGLKKDLEYSVMDLSKLNINDMPICSEEPVDSQTVVL